MSEIHNSASTNHRGGGGVGKKWQDLAFIKGNEWSKKSTRKSNVKQLRFQEIH